MHVYADNAATTKMNTIAIAAMLPCFDSVYGNPSSLYSVGQKAKEHLENARARIAACIGADPNEIIFTSGGSEADNQAIVSAAKIGERSGKKHIISTAFEHHAVLHTLERLGKDGFDITLLDVPENGIISPEQVKNAIRPDTCLVTVMYANNEIGTIQPVSEIGAICRGAGVLFHTDAVQAAGHLHIDVKAQSIDMLSASAHKFHGPKGIGILYAKKEYSSQVLSKAERRSGENVQERKTFPLPSEWRRRSRICALTRMKIRHFSVPCETDLSTDFRRFLTPYSTATAK